MLILRCHGSVVSIETGDGLEGRGVGVRDPVVWRIISSYRSGRMWGLLSHVFGGYRDSFPREMGERSVTKLTTILQLASG
jgi:hypothetical protein